MRNLRELIKNIRYDEYLIVLGFTASNILVNYLNRPYCYNLFKLLSFLLLILPSRTLFGILTLLFLNYKLYQKDKKILSLKNHSFLNSIMYFFRKWWTLIACYIIYYNTKPYVPFVVGFRYDNFLAKIDDFLFFGFSLIKDLYKFHNPFLNNLMPIIYISAFPLYFFTLVYFFYKSKDFEFEVLKFATIFLYLSGTIGYYILPAMGPVFVYPKYYSDINFPLFIDILFKLIAEYNNLKQHFSTHYIIVFSGIGAFPSLHVAHSFLYTYFMARHAKPIIKIIYFIWFILIWISTVYCGMHYFIDGIGGLILSLISIKIGYILYSRGKN